MVVVCGGVLFAFVVVAIVLCFGSGGRPKGLEVCPKRRQRRGGGFGCLFGIDFVVRVIVVVVVDMSRLFRYTDRSVSTDRPNVLTSPMLSSSPTGCFGSGHSVASSIRCSKPASWSNPWTLRSCWFWSSFSLCCCCGCCGLDDDSCCRPRVRGCRCRKQAPP